MAWVRVKKKKKKRFSSFFNCSCTRPAFLAELTFKKKNKQTKKKRTIQFYLQMNHTRGDEKNQEAQDYFWSNKQGIHVQIRTWSHTFKGHPSPAPTLPSICMGPFKVAPVTHNLSRGEGPRQHLQITLIHHPEPLCQRLPILASLLAAGSISFWLCASSLLTQSRNLQKYLLTDASI